MSQETVDSEVARIARRVRRWREEAGVTLQELAQRSGVATSTIQKVETFQMIPTVAVLLKIARGLGRSVAEFVSDGPPVTQVVHLTPGQRHRVGPRRQMVFERLSGDLENAEVELWRVWVQPGHGSGRPVAYQGECLAVGEEGEVTFQIGDEEFPLQAGHTLHFKAWVDHSWRNSSDETARFLILGTVPSAMRAALQHRERSQRTGAKAKEGR